MFAFAPVKPELNLLRLSNLNHVGYKTIEPKKKTHSNLRGFSTTKGSCNINLNSHNVRARSKSKYDDAEVITIRIQCLSAVYLIRMWMFCCPFFNGKKRFGKQEKSFVCAQKSTPKKSKWGFHTSWLTYICLNTEESW